VTIASPERIALTRSFGTDRPGQITYSVLLGSSCATRRCPLRYAESLRINRAQRRGLASSLAVEPLNHITRSSRISRSTNHVGPSLSLSLSLEENHSCSSCMMRNVSERERELSDLPRADKYFSDRGRIEAVSCEYPAFFSFNSAIPRIKSPSDEPSTFE
jgi:hypothetical protein